MIGRFILKLRSHIAYIFKYLFIESKSSRYKYREARRVEKVVFIYKVIKLKHAKLIQKYFALCASNEIQSDYKTRKYFTVMLR